MPYPPPPPSGHLNQLGMLGQAWNLSAEEDVATNDEAANSHVLRSISDGNSDQFFFHTLALVLLLFSSFGSPSGSSIFLSDNINGQHLRVIWSGVEWALLHSVLNPFFVLWHRQNKRFFLVFRYLGHARILHLNPQKNEADTRPLWVLFFFFFFFWHLLASVFQEEMSGRRKKIVIPPPPPPAPLLPPHRSAHADQNGVIHANSRKKRESTRRRMSVSPPGGSRSKKCTFRVAEKIEGKMSKWPKNFSS